MSPSCGKEQRSSAVAMSWQQAVAIQHDLLAALNEDSFQHRLRRLRKLAPDSAGKQGPSIEYQKKLWTLLGPVFAKVLPRHGYSGDADGASLVMGAFGHFRHDEEVAKNAWQLNEALGLPQPKATPQSTPPTSPTNEKNSGKQNSGGSSPKNGYASAIPEFDMKVESSSQKNGYQSPHEQAMQKSVSVTPQLSALSVGAVDPKLSAIMERRRRISDGSEFSNEVTKTEKANISKNLDSTSISKNVDPTLASILERRRIMCEVFAMADEDSDDACSHSSEEDDVYNTGVIQLEALTDAPTQGSPVRLYIIPGKSCRPSSYTAIAEAIQRTSLFTARIDVQILDPVWGCESNRMDMIESQILHAEGNAKKDKIGRTTIILGHAEGGSLAVKLSLVHADGLILLGSSLETNAELSMAEYPKPLLVALAELDPGERMEIGLSVMEGENLTVYRRWL